MKTTRCIRINPAENGWVVIELIHTESENDDEYDEPAYDEGHEERHCHHEEKVHVFSDHVRLMAWVAERTKPE